MSYTVETAVTDRFEMKYLKFGQGDKPFVIIPGLSLFSVLASAPLIEKQFELLKEDFTVYLFDRRNIIPENYSVYDMADDTADAMRAIGLSGVSLYGASQGGMISMAIAVKYPKLVNALVIASTVCRTEGREDAVREWMRLAKENEAEKLCLSFGQKVYSKEVFEANRAAFSDMAKLAKPDDLERFFILAGAVDGFDITGELSGLACPVLVLGDTDDAVFGSGIVEETAKALENNPEAKHFVYSGYGHAVYDTAPDFIERIHSFLTGK